MTLVTTSYSSRHDRLFVHECGTCYRHCGHPMDIPCLLDTTREPQKKATQVLARFSTYKSSPAVHYGFNMNSMLGLRYEPTKQAGFGLSISQRRHGPASLTLRVASKVLALCTGVGSGS